MTNLLESFESITGDLLIRQLSSHLGESAESITSATKLASAAVLAGIVQQGTAGDGAKNIVDFLKKDQMGQDQVSSLNSMYVDQQALEMTAAKGSSALTFLMGDRMTGVMDYLSGHSGLKSSSSSALLKIVAPMMLGLLEKYIREKSLDRQGIKSLLQHQRSFIKTAMPQALTQSLGFDSISESGPPATVPGMGIPPSTESHTSFSKVLPWIVLLLAALGMFYFVEKGCGGHTPLNANPEEMRIDSTQLDSL